MGAESGMTRAKHDGERLVAYVARVQRLLRALEAAGHPPDLGLPRNLTEGLAEQSRWAMLLAEQLQREEDDGR